MKHGSARKIRTQFRTILRGVEAPSPMKENVLRLIDRGIAATPRPIADFKPEEAPILGFVAGEFIGILDWYPGTKKWLSNSLAFSTRATHAISIVTLNKNME